MNVSEREAAADVLKALAHPLRLGLMEELLEGEKNCSDLMERLDTSQSMLSQQLKILIAQGLVQCRKEGRTKFCMLANQDMKKLFACLGHHIHNYVRIIKE
jgi:ArsR family transcriptional regulator